MMPLSAMLSDCWRRIQGDLFPWLEEELGPLSDKHKQIITVFEVARIEVFVEAWSGLPGRPPAERAPLARSFVAKAVLGLPTTAMLIERLDVDKTLRRLCGWQRRSAVPSEATFSRAFGEFAECGLPARVHEALIERTFADRLVGHISRDATAIEAREQPVQAAAPERPKRKRGRPKKGEVVAKKEPRRLQRQTSMMLPEMLADLPISCNVGTKRNAKGHKESWIGYKLHLDVADGDIPIACLMTAASVHDSQVAIPLATITAQRVTNCYDLMDSAYDAPEIWETSRALGHVPIIDRHPRSVTGGKVEIAAQALARRHANYRLAEDVRYNERSAAERVNGAVKDNYGGRYVRVRGHAKVFCHLMFGIVALTVDQLMRLLM